MYKQIVDGIKVWIDDEDEVMYPSCVGCGNYFNDGPCESCGMEEA